MPQESRTSLQVLKEIYKVIEAEVAGSIENGESLLVMGDLNCNVGKEVNGNTEEVTKGGRLLMNLIRKWQLKIVNGTECCKGLWTRKEGTQKSVIDYVIVKGSDLSLFKEMCVDEEKDITP